MKEIKDRRPILVTGGHRSGTTWVGKMLAVERQTAYISEPLNLWHRPGVLITPVDYWYPYICEQNEDRYLPGLCQTLQYHYHLRDEIKALRSRKDLLRMVRDWRSFQLGRIYHKRPVIKDPFALFSVPWFAQRLDCRVVITVRHPAAFASSLKRLGWNFEFSNLLQQPLLMRDWLEPYRHEMEAMLDTPDDIIAQGSLLWRILYQVVDQFRDRVPGLLIVRHEDLSLEPIDGFQDLFTSLGLGFSSRVKKAILNTSSSKNPRELAKEAIHAINLDSRANLRNWKRRLEPGEIKRIRRLTEDVAAIYYPELVWE